MERTLQLYSNDLQPKELIENNAVDNFPVFFTVYDKSDEIRVGCFHVFFLFV